MAVLFRYRCNSLKRAPISPSTLKTERKVDELLFNYVLTSISKTPTVLAVSCEIFQRGYLTNGAYGT
jgi:hypothetical protein